MTHLLVAAGTRCSAQAGADVAAMGGNAIDAAVAAAVASWVCEPGMTAIGSALIAMVRPAGGTSSLIDGLTAMPGLDGHQGTPPGGMRITMPYGPGVLTGVGPASVAVPGGPAGAERIQKEWGCLKWPDVLAPAIALARDGFPFPSVSAAYMPLSGVPIYDHTPGSQAIWRDAKGAPRTTGSLTQLPDLANDLQRIADHGAADFYTGELGERIGTWVVEHGGAMSPHDLATYEVDIREPLTCNDHGWLVSVCDTIGGQALAALVSGFAKISPGDCEEAPRLVACLADVLSRRDAVLQKASASTTQVCAVDQDGNACSITTSTGYGSGVVVPGTGSMLNNMLGELELLPNGPTVLRPGQRLPSNMTPLIAAKDNDVVALGAAGAERICSAIAQTWRGIVARGEAAAAAVEAPRFHVRTSDSGRVVDYEPGFVPTGIDTELNAYDGHHMYFGGVQAAARRCVSSIEGGGDPRRGGTVATA